MLDFLFSKKYKKFTPAFFFVCLFVLSFLNKLWGIDYYWVAGGALHDWTDGSNWSLTSGGTSASAVPGPGDKAIIDTASLPHYPEISSSVSIAELEVQAGASVTVASGGDLTVNGALTGAGDLIVNGGSVSLNYGTGGTASSIGGMTLGAGTAVAIGNDAADSLVLGSGTLTLPSTLASLSLAGSITAPGGINLAKDATLSANTVFENSVALAGNLIISGNGTNRMLTFSDSLGSSVPSVILTLEDVNLTNNGSVTSVSLLFTETSSLTQTFVPHAGTTYGSVTVNKTSGGDFKVIGRVLKASDITVTNAGAVSFDKDLTVTNALTLTASGGITFNEKVTANTITDFSSAGNITFKGGAEVTNAVTFSTTGNLVLGDGAADNFVFGAGMTAVSPALKKLAGTITASSGNIDLGNSQTTAASDVTLKAVSGSVTLASFNSTAGFFKVDAGTSASFNGNVSAGGDISVSSGSADITISHSVSSAGGNISFNSTSGDIVLNSSSSVSSSGGNISFNSTTSSGKIILNSSATDVVSNTASGKTVKFNSPVVLEQNASVSSKGDITFEKTVNSGTNEKSLTINAPGKHVEFKKAVGGTKPLASFTVVNSGSLTFNDALKVTGIFKQTNVATGATIFGGETAKASTSVGSADLKGTSYTFYGKFNATFGPITVTNSGLFLTEEDADITLLSGNFTQNGTGLNQLAGGIITSGSSTVSFATDVYLYGSGGIDGEMKLGGSSGAFTIGVSGAKNLHIAASSAKKININSPLVANNIVLYGGRFFLGGTNGAVTTKGDLILLGSAYNIDDTASSESSGVTGLFAYNHVSRYLFGKAASYTEGFKTLCPDGTTPIPTSYVGSVEVSANKKITVEKNFYANGVTINGPVSGAWTLELPDNDNAANAFAEAYNTTVSKCNVYKTGTLSPMYVAAAENCTVPACTGWAVSRPLILANDVLKSRDMGNVTDPSWTPNRSGTYTVYDDVIRIEFVDSSTGNPRSFIENTNNEISAAVSKIEYYSGSGSTMYRFAGSFVDADCTISTDGKGDLSVFYLKTDPLNAAHRWNTDATGISAGNSDSTDRGRKGGTPDGSSAALPAHRTCIPYINLPKALSGVYQTLRDSRKNRIAHYVGNSNPLDYDIDGDGINDSNSRPGARFTAVADRADPVLAAVYTGQELHIPYSATYDSQPPYDAHNFIELKYSEEVKISHGGTEVVPKNAVNIPASAVYGNVANLTGDGLELSGFVKIEKGRVSCGNSDGSGDPVYSMYRNFALTALDARSYTSSYSNEQPTRVRISVAGYSNGQISQGGYTYRNWKGYINSDQTTPPSGEITRTINAGITDISAAYKPASVIIPNALDSSTSTGNHALSVLTVNGASDANSELYGSWDVSPPCFAPSRFASPWSSAGSIDEYEALGTGNSGTSVLNRVEIHLFDNTPSYDADPLNLDPAAWRSKAGWCLGHGADDTALKDTYTYAADIFGGAKPFAFASDPSLRNFATGGIRYCSLYNQTDKFKYTTDLSQVPSQSFDVSNAIICAVKSPFFNASGAQSRSVTSMGVDSLYFSIPLADLTLPLSQIFKIAYDNSGSYITDLAGNRMRSAVIRTIDRTPPEFSITLAPLGGNKLYILFNKKLNTSSLNWIDNSGNPLIPMPNALAEIPKSLELVKAGAITGSTELRIDATAPAKLYSVNERSTGLILTLTKNVTLDDVKDLHVCVKNTGFATDPVTRVNNSYVSYIQDVVGNYASVHTAHALSDFAVGAVQVQYAYDNRNTASGVNVGSGLYENSSWAVRSWDAEQGNYGTLLAGHDIFINAVLYDGTADNSGGLSTSLSHTKTPVLFADKDPDAASVSVQYNYNTGSDLRVWLPSTSPSDVFPSLSSANNSGFIKFEDGYFINPPLSTAAGFLLPVTTDSHYSDWKAGDQITFMFGLVDSSNSEIKICHTPVYPNILNYSGVNDTAKAPLYALRLKDPNDIASIDLWSFKLKDLSLQRGGVSIFNNVINVNAGEKVVIQVDMPQNGELNVAVMTLDGNIVTYLQHGRASQGVHNYRWDGKNNAGTKVARGMYFIRVSGSGFDETRKVMVVKE
ncbi:hypothetical protein HRQ91_05115 [Treponema parvum]|uniref:FlgD/Vpr Ig-like domain-containing protein n=1 Tax=Treponema parvum TaxID=138851 RepID=A0A975F4I4_9SPIR|nr:FlgD immunoglobulin-like domain containing protein [Treponema parvum]QTQ13884.1 hypothetical protein HRQ91_05115 [Treponema parvum]